MKLPKVFLCKYSVQLQALYKQAFSLPARAGSPGTSRSIVPPALEEARILIRTAAPPPSPPSAPSPAAPPATPTSSTCASTRPPSSPGRTAMLGLMPPDLVVQQPYFSIYINGACAAYERKRGLPAMGGRPPPDEW